MPTRQYIGARYVPKFYTNSTDGSTQWEPNVVYEPLVYVTLTNGHMYISKKQVPATIGTPASNATYWLDIGSYNGMIEDLQSQINEINTLVEQVNTNLSNEIHDREVSDNGLSNRITSEVSTRETADTDLSSRITAEVNARTTQCGDLSTAITTEANTRSTADNSLSTRINDEASERASADNAINARIDQLVSPTGEAPSAAEVTDARIGANGYTYSSLGDAIRTQITNVTNETTDGLIDIAESRVDANHFVEDVVFDSAGFVDRSGVIQSVGGGNWYRSNFIALRNVNLIVANLNDNAAVYQAYFFTKTRTPISGAGTGTNDGRNHEFTLSKADFPNNAEYVIFTARVDSLGTGYYAKCYYDYDVCNDSYVNDCFEKENITFTEGKFIDVNGIIQTSADWKIASIKVDNIDHIKAKLTPNNAVFNVSFYTESEEFISSINTTHLKDVVIYNSDIPSTASYIMFCGAKVDTDVVEIYYRKYSEQNLHLKEISFPNSAFRKPDGSVQKVSNSWASSNLIPLKDVVRIYWKLTVNALVSNVSFFDKMSNYLTGLNLSSVSYLGGYNVVDKKDFPANAEYVEFSGSDDMTVTSVKILTYGDMVDKTIITLGDSIVSHEVVGTGAKIADELHMNIVDLSHGNATASDYYESGVDVTIETPTVDYLPNGSAEANAKNVLSNQIRNAICKAYNVGATVTYTHPIDGSFTLNNAIWQGTGNSGYTPDVIYLSIGINDGVTGTTANLPYHEDSATVIAQSYSELTKETLSSGLRWAIETLQCVFPKADIFVTSLLPTGNDVTSRMKWATCNEKRTSIKNICDYCGVHFIDQFYESCYSTLIASSIGSNDGIHPKEEWARLNAKYLSRQIENKFRCGRV